MKKNFRTRLCGSLLLFFYGCCVNAQKENRYSVIPYPAKLIEGNGSFIISAQTPINISGNSLFTNEANLLAELFTNSFGQALKIKDSKGNCIDLIYDAGIVPGEGYKINITNRSVKLAARTPAGMFMAVQTIRQLLPAPVEKASDKQTSLNLPAVSIEDAPAFAWRGIHLDVSRHFFSMEYLRKLIDRMALYKMNKFHLHLTDDQGWRIEIKKYPKLTEEGAWRAFNNQDSICIKRSKDNPDLIIDPKHITNKNGKILYGGFYSQQQMKDLVAYAALKHVDIIPEIDMPGHMMAAINSYMYLSCDNTSTFGKFFSTPICPCDPAVLDFAKDIYTEIMDIFPSEYIHIGGDEVERSHWERSSACKEMMQREGMKTTAELQAWFIREMEKFFNSKGKKLIGWDEILEGGVTKTAAIMYWRTWVPKAPVEAAKHGNKVIMSPGNPLYFSEQPDKNSLAAVYNYDLIPKDLSAEEATNIIGAQGNLWTEYIPTEQRADYLYMPRMIALSEITWASKKDYNSFLKRLNVHYKRLDNLNVNYRIPDLQLLDNYAFTDSFNLTIAKPIDDIVIRYTTDGSLPTQNSTILKNRLVIKESQQIRIAAFKSDGRKGDVYNIDFNKQQLAQAINNIDTKNGLKAAWYKKAFDSTTLIDGVPDGQFNVNSISVPKEAEVPSFTLQYKGYINIPSDGIYTFYLTSDDAAVLKIAGRVVVNNDGMHAPKEKNGQVALSKGLHSIALDFIEGGGGYTLKIQYSYNESERKDIPASWLKQ